MVDLPRVAVDRAGDDVKTHARCSRAVFAEPRRSASAQPHLFAVVDGLFGPTGGVAASRFNFDEDDGAPAAHNQIDLDTAAADVAPEHAIAARFEERGGTRLPRAAQFEARRPVQ